MLNSKICVLLISSWIVLVKGQNGKDIGDSCLLDDDTAGKCMQIDNCEYAKLQFAQGKKPKLCSYGVLKPIVCCKQISISKCEEYKNLAYKNIGSLTSDTGSDYNDKRRRVRNCKVQPVASLVKNGETTKPGEFPHMAAIGYDSTEGIRFLCGGTLISENFVLSAAHCAKKPSIVRLGAQTLYSPTEDTNPKDYKIIKIIKHENYSRSSTYDDIALFELDGPVSFSPSIRPACLWKNDKIIDAEPTATGWGMLEFLGATSNDLQKVSLDILDNEKCIPYFKGIELYGNGELSKGIISSQLCAAAIEGDKLVGGKDTCEGDSGGPLQIPDDENGCVYHILGITSFSQIGCGEENSPGVYTRVSSYIDWIESKVWPNN